MTIDNEGKITLGSDTSGPRSGFSDIPELQFRTNDGTKISLWSNVPSSGGTKHMYGFSIKSGQLNYHF